MTMSHDPNPTADEQALLLQRNETLLHDLNARIARLAIALGVSLQNEQEIADAIHSLQGQGGKVEQERRSGEGRHLGSSERRASYIREELRGLLVLRYGEHSRLVAEWGVTVTRKLMAGAEAQLDRDGFAPGADGVNRHDYLDTD